MMALGWLWTVAPCVAERAQLPAPNPGGRLPFAEAAGQRPTVTVRQGYPSRF
jgi:hypothetical protein